MCLLNLLQGIGEVGVTVETACTFLGDCCWVQMRKNEVTIERKFYKKFHSQYNE